MSIKAKKMSEEILTEEKQRVADLARSEAIEKMKLKPKFKALPRNKRRELLREWQKK